MGRASPQGNQEGRNSTLSQILGSSTRTTLPSLKQMSIYDIRRPQLLGVLARIEERKAFTTAEKGPHLAGAVVPAMPLSSWRGWKPIRPPTWTWWPSPSPVNHSPYLHLPALPNSCRSSGSTTLVVGRLNSASGYCS